MPNLDPLSEPALVPWLDGFVDARVLVVGDIMLDRYVGGEVRRISPEAPIPVLRAQSRRSVLGGAGNVAQNIAALGGQVVLVGVVGRDDAAGEMAALIAATPAISAQLVTAPRPSSVKTRFMSGSHQLLRLDEEMTEPVEGEVEADLLAAIAAALGGASISFTSTPGSITTPSATTQMVSGFKIPAGTRWNLYSSLPTVTEWPALLPPP